MSTAIVPIRIAAFLRGVNVGGHRKLPMAALRMVLQERGLRDVATYLQSGNIVCTSMVDAAATAALIHGAIEAEFGFSCPVIVRDHAAMQAVLAAHPFAAEETDPTRLHVFFADAEFDAAGIAAIDPKRFGVDRCAAIGRELYLHTPKGLGQTKLTIDVFERALGCSFTQRNWRSVQAVASLFE